MGKMGFKLCFECWVEFKWVVKGRYSQWKWVRMDVGINKVLGGKQIGLSDKSRGCLEGNVRMFQFSNLWKPERKFEALHLLKETALNCWAGGHRGTAQGNSSAHWSWVLLPSHGWTLINQDNIRSREKKTTHSEPGSCSNWQCLRTVCLRTTLFSAHNGSRLGTWILVFPRQILNLKVLAVPVFSAIYRAVATTQRSGQDSITHTFPSQPHSHQHPAELWGKSVSEVGLCIKGQPVSVLKL